MGKTKKLARLMRPWSMQRFFFFFKNRAAREEPRAAQLYLRSTVPLKYIPTQFSDRYLQPGQGRV